MTTYTGLNEALRLVIGAQNDLTEAVALLGSARNWGIFDLLGGGLITSLIKHGKLDDAANYVQAARCKLESARRALNVGADAIDFDLEAIGGFARFFDIASSSFLADLWVQGQIADRREQIEIMLAKVKNLRRALETAASCAR